MAPSEEHVGAVQQAPETLFIDEEGDDPTAINDRRFSGRCYGSSATGGECEPMGLSFDSADEWDEHRQRHHPTPCGGSGGSCFVLAAYRRDGSPHGTCYKHLPDDPDNVYKWSRTNTKSVVEPPKAEGHIIEEVLPDAD